MKELEKIFKIRDVKMSIGDSAFHFFSTLIGIVLIGGFLLFVVFFFIKLRKDRKPISSSEPVSKIQMYIQLYMSQLKGYKQIVILSNRSFLLLSEFGFYFFYVIEEEGLLEGAYTDVWLSKKGEKAPVYNPFLSLQKEFEKCPVKDCQGKILLTSNVCYLNVFDYVEEKVIKEKNLLAEMDKLFGSEKIYTKEEVDSFYDQCKDKAVPVE